MRLQRFQEADQCYLAVDYNNAWYRLSLLPTLKNIPDDVLVVMRDWEAWRDQISAGLDSAIGDSKNQMLPVPESAIPVLPFQPLSLRDCMLSETHATNAARGIVKTFMPLVYPLVCGIEKLTRRPFPALKPKAVWYQQPLYYFSNHLNIAKDGDTVHWPSYTDYLDYEIELACVLRKPLFNATEAEALGAIGGFMVLNDFSARDVQLAEMRSGFGPQKAKHFVNGLANVLTTADEILPLIQTLKAEVMINNRVVCQSSTADMQHSVAQVLMHLSKDEALHPGEVVGFGTLPGGCALENGHWLQAGDVIKISIERIGSLTNTIGQRKN
ncbi:MAG: fumarylacetoacetate hydrolase family protein [Oleibacter sp.]|nr:fumarylacetoacetate hydrolase family protein [Thalassolituus sp.]